VSKPKQSAAAATATAATATAGCATGGPTAACAASCRFRRRWRNGALAESCFELGVASTPSATGRDCFL
jgi:hypothetical protein